MEAIDLSNHLMWCPNKCGNRINKVLVCSGRTNALHKGLPFRSVRYIFTSSFLCFDTLWQCKQCKFFEMLTEEEAAAVGFVFPANDELNMRAGPLPSMQPQSFSGTTSTLQTIARPPKRQCSVQRCKRVWADECGLCKTCCGVCGQGCTSQKHLQAPPRTMRATSFTPMRPQAVLPPLQVTSAEPQPMNRPSPSSSSQISSGLDIAQRLFRDDMPDDWAKEWKEREEEARKRREAAELRKKNERAMAHQVVIQLWREVRGLPYSRFARLIFSHRMAMHLS